MEVLKLDNLSKYYTSQSSVTVGLTGINLSFSTGEFVAITGESGSGKSTLAHVLGGIIPYESGEMYVYGKPTSHYDAKDWESYRRDYIGFISQSYGILPGNTALENVESALILGGASRSEAREKALAILDEVELGELAKRRAGKMSSGQKQRLSIARALAKPSKILIADEPTGNLDRENSEKVIKLLKSASKDRLVILITHDFDEARDYVTRRVALADGNVVTDAELSQADKSESAVAPNIQRGKSSHSAYVTSLTLRSRPIFSAIMCLLLAFTAFITFVFIGTFTVALDDTPTRIYDNSAFRNGDKTRIVVMRQDHAPLSSSDYQSILSVKHTDRVDSRGYVNDVNYYYRPNVDYYLRYVTVNGPNYHSVTNPYDYYINEMVNFYEKNLFVHTVPVTDTPMLSAGRMPKGFYEVLSADPDYKVGDKLTVYFRHNNNWNISRYMEFVFTVTGESQNGEGLYFSDTFAAMLSASFDHKKQNSSNTGLKDVAVPYSPDSFIITQYLNEEGKIVEADIDDQPTLPEFEERDFWCIEDPTGKIKPGRNAQILMGGDDVKLLTCKAIIKYEYPITVVHESIFNAVTDFTSSDQVSLYIDDYAYSDRVISALEEKGYIALSPYKLGSTNVKADLENDRQMTLRLCSAAIVLILVLQIILLRAMFSSLNDSFRLMSNIGLLSKGAKGAVATLLAIYTLLGELIGGAVILITNAAGVQRVADIFKYLDGGTLALLFCVHLISVALAAPFVIQGMMKAVFVKAKRFDDIDIEDKEDE